MRETFVLNPNGSARATASIESCIEPPCAVTRRRITCGCIPVPPKGIESDTRVAEAAPMVLEHSRHCSADAIFASCFSDPGVEAARILVAVPAIRNAEAADYAALRLGRRFRAISRGPASVSRHARHLGKLKTARRFADDRQVNKGVSEASSGGGIAHTVIGPGMALRGRDGADAAILGCAGMGKRRDRLQAVLGLPADDPVQAAAATAAAQLDIGYFREGC